MYIGCVCLSTQGSPRQTCMESFDLLQEDVCGFQAKGRVLNLGDFDARVGKGDEVDDVIGFFGGSGNLGIV